MLWQPMMAFSFYVPLTGAARGNIMMAMLYAFSVQLVSIYILRQAVLE